jgi:small subunit ribosomal protein S19
MIEGKKDFTYRGKKIEELQGLDTREFAKLLKSRARRAVLRQFDVIEKFIKESKKKIEQGKEIRTHLRHLVVVPKMINMKIGIHNGKEFINIQIINEMLGHRLGEFVQTRKKVEHGAPGIGATKSSASMSVK